MIVKALGLDYKFEDEMYSNAMTLDWEHVTDDETLESGTHSKTHDSGWTITGELCEDYVVWVNEFVASHPDYGIIAGDFEKFVIVSSEKTFQHFMEHHKPTEWDYEDV